MATARPPLSPSRSPTGRLPSPPPIAEDQSAPQSPGLQANHTLPAPHVDTHAASRRIRPGTKAADMAEGPPLVELSDIDSPFQLTEHLKSLHHTYTHPSADLTSPLTKQLATQLAHPPTSIDRTLWLYELCRFLVQKVNGVIVGLFADTPACSAQTCPEMRASEWQYLCAVHDPPKACCAIDYCCHTLDWAANTLTSPKHFPSRLSLGPDNAAPQHQLRQLTNIFRRVYRIFAHAWFSHRDMFWRMEGKTGLYVFFKTVCDSYSLIPEDNYTIPPEAEGKEPPAVPAQTSPTQSQFPAPQALAAAPASILKRPTSDSDPFQTDAPSTDNTDQQQASALAPGATARRHRHSPSKGAPVGTVPEETEEEDDDPTADPADSTTDPDQPTDETTDKPLMGSLTRADTQIHSPVTSSAPSSSAPAAATADATADDDDDAPTPFPNPAEDTSPPNITDAEDTAGALTQAQLQTPASDAPADADDEPVSVPVFVAEPQSLSGGAKSFASFSPASPKASTFEELAGASAGVNVGGAGAGAAVEGEAKDTVNDGVNGNGSGNGRGTAGEAQAEDGEGDEEKDAQSVA